MNCIRRKLKVGRLKYISISMKNYLCLLIIFSAVFTSAHAQKLVLDRVIAKLGGEVTLYSDIEAKLALMKEQRGSIPPDANCMLLESEMVTNLLINQAVLDSVVVSDDEVETQMNARMEQILSMMNNDLDLFQEVYGQTVAQMKNQVRDDMRKKLLAQRMQQTVMASVDVTPSEVIEFFNQIPVDSLPYFNSEVEIAEIVYFPVVNAEEKQKALDKIQNVQNLIAEGSSFEELAQTYSDDYGSARDGGNLGFNSRGTFVPEFEAAAYKLENGEISEIVESQFGFHIIKMLERRGNSINTQHILVKPRMTDADIELGVAYMDSIRQLIMADSMTFQEAVKKFSDDRMQSYSNGGRMVNTKTGDTFFEMADVDSEIFFAIDSVEVGGMTNPIEFKSQTGEPILRLVQLQSRSTPHRASLEQDYSKIQAAAKDSKKNEAFNDWIDSKIKNTFIQVTPTYLQCPNIQKWIETSMVSNVKKPNKT